MKLKLIGIVSEEFGTRHIRDRRRRPDTVIASYRGEDGEEYRKMFSAYGRPVVPEEGTHETLRAMREQWTV